MTNEQLNSVLVERMSAEMKEYEDWLLSQPLVNILLQAQEYAVRQDIIASFELYDLPDAEAQVLLKSRTPLADIYTEWQYRGKEYLDQIWESVESRAKSALQQPQIKVAQKKARDQER